MLDFASVLGGLRALVGPCAPPVGVGSFVPLYANDREVVVWYSPAREAQTAGEITIPCERLAAAWQRLAAGERLARETLEAEGERPARAMWLLVLLAQVPGVQAAGEPLAVWWESPAEATSAPRRQRTRTRPAHARTKDTPRLKAEDMAPRPARATEPVAGTAPARHPGRRS
ncbi:MAG: hypothetical protein ACHQ4H_06160 [Ktedonobacterales bacterium]